MSANSTVIAARLFRSQRYMVLLVVTVFVSLLIITSVFARDYVNMSSIPDKVTNYYQTVKGSSEGSSFLDFFSGTSGGDDDADVENSQIEALENKEAGIEKEEGAIVADEESVEQGGGTTTESTKEGSEDSKELSGDSKEMFSDIKELSDDSKDEPKQDAAAEIPESLED